MADPSDHQASRRLSSEAGPRLASASLRSINRLSLSTSPKPAGGSTTTAGTSSSQQGGPRKPSAESAPQHSSASPPSLPDESTLKARPLQPALQRPPFHPLFTLICDTTSSPARAPVTHHPKVHYIFSDDDPEVLTQALSAAHQRTAETLGAITGTGADEGASPEASSASPPPPQSAGNDRAVVLDLVPRTEGAGYDVAWAASLSASWAVTRARVSALEGDNATRAAAQGGMTAGGGDGADEGSGAGGQALMLRIEGVSVEGSATAPLLAPQAASSFPEGELASSGASGKGGQQPQQLGEDYGVLIDEFEKRMVVLRKVVDACGERARSVAAAAEATAAAQAEAGGRGGRQAPENEEAGGGSDEDGEGD